ncbi:MAG: SAM-dependent chlorinase/fluorinase, partial [Chloroflexi bacterium]
KGVVLGINPSAQIVDVSHAIQPGRIDQACFVLASAWPYFPGGAIHVAVVDPGVGTTRRPLAMATPRGTFIGPDNGILSAALESQLRQSANNGRLALPPPLKAHLLAEERFRVHPVSRTFHGRDIFAPAAGYLSLGIPVSHLGPPVEEVAVLPPPEAEPRPDGSLLARVLHIDRFGSLITTARAEQLPSQHITVTVRGRNIQGLSQTYAAGEGLLALIGSGQMLEIASSGGSAQAELSAELGDEVLIRPS